MVVRMSRKYTYLAGIYRKFGESCKQVRVHAFIKFEIHHSGAEVAKAILIVQHKYVGEINQSISCININNIIYTFVDRCSYNDYKKALFDGRRLSLDLNFVAASSQFLPNSLRYLYLEIWR